MSRCFWLDVLRVVLCAGVVIYHYTPERPSSGPMCVDGFFVLSGFLLAAGFERMAGKGGMDVCTFYGSKARRLLPTLCVSWVIGFLLLIYLEEPLLPEWDGSEFRLGCFVEHYNVPSWYMVSELAFLGLAPFLFCLYRQGWKAMLALVTVMMVYSRMLYDNVPTACLFGYGLYFQPQVRLWQFSAGILAWMLLAHIRPRLWMNIVTGLLAVLAVSVLATLCVVKQFTTMDLYNYSWRFDAKMVLLFALLVPGLAKIPPPQGRRVRVWFAYAAALTYPVYLYHVPVYKWMIGIADNLDDVKEEPFVWGVTAFTITFILSALSLKYLDGFFAKKKKRPTPAP